MILAFDPGEKNIGFAMFSYNAEEKMADLKALKVLSKRELYTILAMAEGLLKEGKKHTFVIENFRVDSRVRGVNFQWSEMETIRVIGSLEYAAFRMNDSPVVFQEPRILGMGRKWCDLKVNKGHIQDDVAAYMHGAYYMMSAGMIGGVSQIRKFGQESL